VTQLRRTTQKKTISISFTAIYNADRWGSRRKGDIEIMGKEKKNSKSVRKKVNNSFAGGPTPKMGIVFRGNHGGKERSQSRPRMKQRLVEGKIKR